MSASRTSSTRRRTDTLDTGGSGAPSASSATNPHYGRQRSNSNSTSVSAEGHTIPPDEIAFARRASHNAVERQRRDALNLKYLALGQALPALENIRRPSKTSIINEALAFVVKARTIMRENEALKRENAELKTKLGITEPQQKTTDDTEVTADDKTVIPHVSASDDEAIIDEEDDSTPELPRSTNPSQLSSLSSSLPSSRSFSFSEFYPTPAAQTVEPVYLTRQAPIISSHGMFDVLQGPTPVSSRSSETGGDSASPRQPPLYIVEPQRNYLPQLPQQYAAHTEVPLSTPFDNVQYTASPHMATASSPMPSPTFGRGQHGLGLLNLPTAGDYASSRGSSRGTLTGPAAPVNTVFAAGPDHGQAPHNVLINSQFYDLSPGYLVAEGQNIFWANETDPAAALEDLGDQDAQMIPVELFQANDYFASEFGSGPGGTGE
ncbi:hypothetical protein SAICODRAFT_20378 [Saitoella complicata NRRL Y-17804]|nr:uncharacterized protein SAICODRAFT_20378 [Saitoella complicata NRRL Y-17804]ODQ51716.1 hypothetical protein SAICODRAFT_20378 [Saitoella complicata NRRL Y-17804]